MKAVFLDASTYGKEFDLSSLDTLPVKWTIHSETKNSEVLERIENFEIIVTNKVKLTKEILQQSSAKLICEAATGYDNIDLEAANARNITVCNIPAYSTPSVVQLTFSFMLHLSGSLLQYVEQIRKGEWERASIFTILDFPIFELEGKSLGIIGYGTIGKRVEKIAKAFGMKVLVAQGRKPNPQALSFLEVIERSDFLTLHTPLTPTTKNLIGEKELKRMKPTSFLINVSRGGIVNEEALAHALKNKTIAGAGFDVLTQEPPPKDHPLLQNDIPNLILTPHIGWGSIESRTRALNILCQNIQSFLSGKPQNVIAPKSS